MPHDVASGADAGKGSCDSKGERPAERFGYARKRFGRAFMSDARKIRSVCITIKISSFKRTR